MFAQLSSALLRPAATAARRGAAPLARAVSGFSSAAAAAPTLLARLGGEPALRAVLDKFYSTLIMDRDVERFFKRTDMAKLKNHQFDFLSKALTELPTGFDPAAYMKRGHKKLLADGLDETHFDVVAKHLVAALASLNVPQPLIDEVFGRVTPLRASFQQAAAEHRAAQAAKGQA